jgi:hypothetical protein
MSEKMSDRMSEDMPDGMPERMSERMSEDMRDRMSEDMPERMSEDLPDRMPEDMSDRMPEDMPVRKCINVMVGIIRSEVFLSDISLMLISHDLTVKTPFQKRQHAQRVEKFYPQL